MKKMSEIISCFSLEMLDLSIGKTNSDFDVINSSLPLIKHYITHKEKIIFTFYRTRGILDKCKISYWSDRINYLIPIPDFRRKIFLLMCIYNKKIKEENNDFIPLVFLISIMEFYAYNITYVSPEYDVLYDGRFSPKLHIDGEDEVLDEWKEHIREKKEDRINSIHRIFDDSY